MEMNEPGWGGRSLRACLKHLLLLAVGGGLQARGEQVSRRVRGRFPLLREREKPTSVLEAKNP